MPYSSVHTLFKIHGSFGQTAAIRNEQWQCSLRINTGSTGTTEAAKITFLDNIAAAVQAFHSSSAVLAGAACWLQELSAAYIDTDGHYLGGTAQTTTVRPYSTPVAGTQTNQLPWDVARVFTLRTAQPRGRGHVGRFYYPVQAEIAIDGRWTQPASAAAAAAAKTLLDAVNTASKAVWTASFGVSVMSFVGAVSYQVNAVEVGRAPDTQRRRTKSLLEEPSSAALAGVLSAAEAAAGRVYG